MAAPPPTTVALLSGGLDSATACALALEAGHRVIGLSFDYGQRHRRELEAASRLASGLGLDEHHTVAVNLAAWGGSSLTDPSLAVPTGGVEEGAIPSTYVPGRNTVFIAIGLSLAEARGAQRLVLGVNAIDYSGYPDCRPDYLQDFQGLAALPPSLLPIRPCRRILRFSIMLTHMALSIYTLYNTPSQPTN